MKKSSGGIGHGEYAQAYLEEAEGEIPNYERRSRNLEVKRCTARDRRAVVFFSKAAKVSYNDGKGIRKAPTALQSLYRAPGIVVIKIYQYLKLGFAL